MADQKSCEVADAGFDSEIPLERLEEIGEVSVIPMLQLLEILIEKDRSVDTLRYQLLTTVTTIKNRQPEVHLKLGSLLEKCCQLNEGKELWQTTPVHIARCLHGTFKGYPPPSMEGNNALAGYQSRLILLLFPGKYGKPHFNRTPVRKATSADARTK